MERQAIFDAGAPVTTETSNLLLGLGLKSKFTLLGTVVFQKYPETEAFEANALYKEENESSLTI